MQRPCKRWSLLQWNDSLEAVNSDHPVEGRCVSWSIRSTNVRGNGNESFEVSSLELLRRAIAHGDQDAWAGFQQCLEEAVLAWLHEHPSREAACRGLCEKDLVVQAFERFRQGAVQAQMTFETLAGVLVYLRASLHGAILDTLRALSRPKEVSILVPGLAGEPHVADQIDSNEIWEFLQTLLPSARERRLAYLIYFCGLGPQEIVQCCPQEWSDVQEIYRLRRNIVERLLLMPIPFCC
jgi:hypothetical protein